MPLVGFALKAQQVVRRFVASGLRAVGYQSAIPTKSDSRKKTIPLRVCWPQLKLCVRSPRRKGGAASLGEGVREGRGLE